MTRLLLLAAAMAGTLAGLLTMHGEPARAAGPCGTTHDAVDSEEQQFLSLLAAWRSTAGVSNEPQQMSGALNKAAAWYAEWQVANGAHGGHSDNLGRNWVQRALDCGYTGQTSGGQPYASGSGEGIFAASGSSLPNVGPQQALTGMIAQGVGSSGIYMSGTGSLPAKCYGVAVRRSGNAVAWVVVIAQYPANGACPGGAGAAPSASPSSSATATPTKTASPTPSPTPSATPTAAGVTIALSPGWNLVVLPSGPVKDVLYRAEGCYRAVYQQQGNQWLRYSPEVPPYANNLQTLNGGTYWIEGTAANCGLVPL